MSAPYIVICHSSEDCTYQVMVENEPTNELNTLSAALIHTIGSYFVYDIAYPRTLNSLLVMIQHFVFELKDGQRDTPSIVEVVSSLTQMDS